MSKFHVFSLGIIVALFFASCIKKEKPLTIEERIKLIEHTYNDESFVDFSFGNWEKLRTATGVIELMEAGESSQVFAYLSPESNMEYDSLEDYTRFINSFWEDGNSYPSSLNRDYEGDTLIYERIYYKKNGVSVQDYVAQIIVLVDARSYKENVLEIYLKKGNGEVLKRDREIKSVNNGTYKNMEIKPHDLNDIRN